jgi:PAS domain S-box-containing protein
MQITDGSDRCFWSVIRSGHLALLPLPVKALHLIRVAKRKKIPLYIRISQIGFMCRKVAASNAIALKLAYIFHFHIHKVPIFSPKVNYLSAINFDREEKYKQLFEQATTAIVITDPESSIILECNQAAAELVEKTKDELIGQHESILYLPEESGNSFTKSFREKTSEVTTLKDGIQLDTKVITKNGKIKNVFINANSIEIGGTKVIYGSFRDVTQQKQIEAALRYSEEQFHILAEDWPNMIFIIQDGRAVYVNHECVRVTGYSKKEIFAPDFDFSTLISPEFQSIIAEKNDRNLKGVDLNPFEFRLLTKNGTPIDAIWSARPITFNGKLGLIGLATDITERKKSEKQISTHQSNWKQSSPQVQTL